MSRSPELYQWRTEIAKHFPPLSQPMVTPEDLLAPLASTGVAARAAVLAPPADGNPAAWFGDSAGRLSSEALLTVEVASAPEQLRRLLLNSAEQLRWTLLLLATAQYGEGLDDSAITAMHQGALADVDLLARGMAEHRESSLRVALLSAAHLDTPKRRHLLANAVAHREATLGSETTAQLVDHILGAADEPLPVLTPSVEGAFGAIHELAYEMEDDLTVAKNELHSAPMSASFSRETFYTLLDRLATEREVLARSNAIPETIRTLVQSRGRLRVLR